MSLSIILASISLVIIYLFTQYVSFQHNLLQARKSGFIYKLAPFSFEQALWLALQNSLIPLIEYLPTTWTRYWPSYVAYELADNDICPLVAECHSFSVLGRIWNQEFAPFERLGSETVILVSPASNVMYTCDPEIISQITSRRSDFPKPMSLLRMLNIYGPTLSGSEGTEARVYRKVTTPSFNERTHRQVWDESLAQTQSMLESWEDFGGHMTNLSEDMGKLALHVISKVFFDKKMEWNDDQNKSNMLPAGHYLTYTQAINAAAENNSTLFLTPKPVLNISPLPIHRRAKQAFHEWRNYMLDMREETRSRLQGRPKTEQPSLLEALVQAVEPSCIQSNESLLSPEAVLGNMHLYILAGHETSANTAAIAISLLAYHPDVQKALQNDLDMILADRLSSSWIFEEDYPRLMSGYVGALLHETLRLYPTLPMISKCTASAPQHITTWRAKYLVLANTLIVVNIAAAHRNPRFWSNTLRAVDTFDPTRWIGRHHEPEAGSYLPFSDGYRSCVGRRFAQIELCALVARIFSQYSVQLDDGLEISRDTRALDDHLEMLMTLRLRTDLPLKFTRRQRETNS